jgi:hypothetical protein
MGADKHDPKGEALLRELDQLQAREALPGIEPPALIDQAVRNMARRALHDPALNPGINQENSPFKGKLGWLTGLATASMAVIALGIALVQTPQTPDLAEPVYKAKKEEALFNPQESRNTLQSADSVHSESAGQQLREADRSVTLERMKQAAEPMASAPETSALAVPAAARLAEEAYAGSTDEFKLAKDQSAQAWLDLIQQLNEQGLATEATEQLRAFLTDHPDYPLPEWALKLQQSQE